MALPTPARYDPVDLEIGLAVALLWLYGPEWIRRRVESFEFTDVRTVRRQVSIDLRLPLPGEESGALQTNQLDALLSQDPPLVPVLLLEKRKLTNLNLWDERGHRLPFQTTSQNGRLSGDALIAAAALASYRAGWRRLEGPFVDALRAIPKLPGDLATALRKMLLGYPSNFRSLANRLERAPRSDDPFADDRQEFHALRQTLVEVESPRAMAQIHSVMDDATVGALARQMTNAFIVYRVGPRIRLRNQERTRDPDVELPHPCRCPRSRRAVGVAALDKKQ